MFILQHSSLSHFNLHIRRHHFVRKIWQLENETTKRIGLTSIIGICDTSCPLSSLIIAQIGRSSSRLCREHTEYTRMKAWPLLMESRCIAGNWWDPVVSVIWSVHMFLLQLITWNIRSIIVPFPPVWISLFVRHASRHKHSTGLNSSTNEAFLYFLFSRSETSSIVWTSLKLTLHQSIRE